MSTREVVTLECDQCGTQGDSVETHSLGVDGKLVETEACGRCWTKLQQAVAKHLTRGRKVPRSRRRAA